LQLTASPWTTEASTRERWQFGTLTNRKATSSNIDPSLTSLYYYQVALSLYRDKWTTIIRLWWLSQWLFVHGHHLVVTIYFHVAPSPGRHIWQLGVRKSGKSGCRHKGALVGLTLKKSPNPPKLKYETLPISGDLVNFSNVKPPCTNEKPPYWRLSGDGSGCRTVFSR